MPRLRNSGDTLLQNSGDTLLNYRHQPDNFLEADARDHKIKLFRKHERAGRPIRDGSFLKRWTAP